MNGPSPPPRTRLALVVAAAVAATLLLGTLPGTQAGEYLVSINWGDGTFSAGMVTLAAGVFTVAGSHAYSSEGRHQVEVVIEPPADVPQVGFLAALAEHDSGR